MYYKIIIFDSDVVSVFVYISVMDILIVSYGEQKRDFLKLNQHAS